MERCPNCRARYQDGTECRRCGMDLSQLLDVEQAADGLLREALARLAAGDARAAADSLTHVRTLRRDPFLDLLLGFAQTLVEAQPSVPEPTLPSRATATPVDAPASR
jgi:hypothetical protein